MCECLTSSPVTDTGGTAGIDGSGGDGGGTVFGLIGTLCSGVQGDFAVVRVSSVWCTTGEYHTNITMQVNTFRLGTKKPATART